MDLIHCSISGPLNKSFSLGEISTPWAIYSTTGHFFILDIIFQIVDEQNWRHVLFMDPYDLNDEKFKGKQLLERAQKLAKRYDICLTSRHDDITDETLASVIICFCNGDQIMELKERVKDVIKEELEKENKSRKFVIVAGSTDESWRERVIWEPNVADLFYVTPRVGYVKEFHDYYASISTKNLTEYPYLEKFRQRYSRLFSSIADSNETFDGTDIYEKTYKNSSRVLNVMKSVFLVAHNTPNSRPELDSPIAFFGEDLEFDGFRLPNGEKFEVYKYQETNNVAPHNFIKIAEYLRRGWEFLSEDYWNDTETGWEPNIIPLFMNKEHFQYSSDEVKSHCSDPCSAGYKKNFEKDRCCWTCTKCDVLERTNLNQTLCIKCDVGEIPDENRNKTHCASISTRIRKPTEWYNWQNLICMCFSSSSVILTIIVSIIFIKQRNTPVVKSTTKELCYVMFAGIALADITIFISALSREFKTPAAKVLPATGFTMIYAALLMKTIRIARILPKSENSFPSIHPKFVSITAQIVTAVALIGLQSLICWHAVQTNDTMNTETDVLNYALKTYYLNGFFLMKIFGFVGVLILFCMYFAVKTRNLPGNYNETMHVAFSMVTTIIIAMFFFLMYLVSEYKILVVNLAISINSLSVLVFLFLPKLNIMLRRPEQNTKAYYATMAPNIRKHVREEPHHQQKLNIRPEIAIRLREKKELEE
ncbi:metabotropic glutamate receptor 1-like isoform X2 [Planococcus citri]